VITARGLTAADGHPTGTLAVIGDITDRRRAEELSQQHLRQLAHMGRVKSLDEMAVAIAHEVAQPLTAITTYVQAALRFLPAEGVHRSVIQDALLGASSQARRASAVVSRIRAFVQDRPWQPRELLVHDLLTETGRFASPEARQHGASLLVAPSRTPCRLLGDEIQIQQVLLNLIRNAAEAMAEHSSPRRQIALAAERTSDGMVDVSVSDTGPGIEAAYRDKLFEAFCSSKKDGVGIGLALCRSIVDAHGGRLWAETPATGGAIFHVVLREVKHGKHTTS
jgi:two-component system sensor kinase FixL